MSQFSTWRTWCVMSAFGDATDTADLSPKTRHFFKPRPEQNHTLDHTLATCPLCANSGHHRLALFDHVVRSDK
jgi:hypothetical protein